MLSRIAHALNVHVADLVDEHELAVREEVLAGPGHAALPAVKDAINRYPLTGGEPQPVEHLAARLAGAWRARHASPDHRTVLGRLLPDLIRDAQVATLAAEGRSAGGLRRCWPTCSA